MVYNEKISLTTKGFSDTIDITSRIAEIARKAGVMNGLVTLFCPGSTATVTTIEFEAGVIKDLQRAVEKFAPSGVPYEHDLRWGDGNGFSHVRAALMKPSLSVPLIDGELSLGTWQQVVFIDFDNRARDRDILVQVLGE